MKKYFLCRKSNGEVVSYSEGQIEFDKTKFVLKEIDLTKDEQDKLKQNYILKVKRGKLQMDKPPYIEKEDIKTSIENATDIDEIKAVINKLI